MAQVRAIDAINPADLGFRDAITGGVLAVNVNPGSGNPIGGQTVALKSWGRSVDEMVLRQPSGLKSALGENPKRVWGEQRKTPATRLGTAAVHPRRVRRRVQLPGQDRAEQRQARGRAQARRPRPQARSARPGAAARDPVAAALPPGRRHRDRDADRRGVRLPAGHRPRHRGASAGRRASPPRASR